MTGKGDSGFHLEQSELGLTMVVTGAWTSEAEQALDSGMADGLELNYAKGFKDTSLSFVRDWPLKRVTVLARTIKDLSPLYRVSNTLESLSVQTSAEAIIELGLLPAVTALAADWKQVHESLGELPLLRDLFLLCYTEHDLAPLRGNLNLERLRLKDRPQLRSLEGLEALQSLAHLGVYLARDLHNIESLELVSSDQLDVLHLEACPSVRNLGPVGHCRSLRFLNASDCGEIDSVGPLAQLDQLEVLWLFGTTKVLDGDLSPLSGLHRLRELRMQSRRSYTPTVAAVQALVAQRGP